MALDGDAVSPSPPPPPPPPPSARTVAAVLALVRAAARPLLCLDLATAWVLSALAAAMSLAHLAWGDGSAAFAFLVALTVAALKVSICIAFLFLAPAVVLCGIGLAYVIAVESRSGSQPKKRAFGPITRESIRELIKMLFPHAVVLGLVADLAFILLSAAGALVMCMSPSVEGSTSQGQMIGSVIMDVGMLGFHAISCFVIIPAFALHIFRKDQADRKAGLTVAVC